MDAFAQKRVTRREPLARGPVTDRNSRPDPQTNLGLGANKPRRKQLLEPHLPPSPPLNSSDNMPKAVVLGAAGAHPVEVYRKSLILTIRRHWPASGLVAQGQPSGHRGKRRSQGPLTI